MNAGDRIRLPSGDYFGRIQAIETMAVVAAFPFAQSADKGLFTWRFHAGSLQGDDQLIVGEPLARFLRIPAGSILLAVAPDTVLQTPPGSDLESPMQRAFRLAHG